ncbi:NADAR family protein [Flavobacterium aciduliphilum]|uniref:NADAR domain-containing protein n=1 Tax=Flavobacterium aciduliphilum TaxID=1101402 RepID=A0A328YLQ5_9FLAO|nr:NADAR family protein [Flavobacterium aciduliphilum]RAR73755.1 hypothetical protein CLV55_10374 [Flavobacterium aciduliphilum]
MTHINLNHQTYSKKDCCWFLKVDTEWGGLSNMKGIIYPLLVNKRKILTSEALYQACRFPDFSEIQEDIIKQTSPMAAKMKSKPHRLKCTRADFEEEKIAIMYWCLRVKLACNPNGFGHLLKKTGNKPIVEVSHKDLFWGTKEDKNNPNIVVGANVLGQLLMELRSFYLDNQESKAYLTVAPLGIPNFKLFGEPIQAVVHPILLSQ